MHGLKYQILHSSFMGKLTALLAGTFAVLILSYYLLSSAYDPIINWIGPFVGYRLVFILGLVYLLLGNPLSHIVLLASWVLIGVVIGIASAKTGRAIGMSLLVYFVSWALIGFALFSLIFDLSNFSRILNASVIGAIPSGTNLYTITTEPVIDRIYSFFISDLASSGGSSPFVSPQFSPISGSISSLIGIFVSNVIESLAILLIVSGVTGHMMSRTFKPKRGSQQHDSGKTGDGKEGIKIASVFLILILIISGVIVFDTNTTHFSSDVSGAGNAGNSVISVNPSSTFAFGGVHNSSPIACSSTFFPEIGIGTPNSGFIRNSFIGYVTHALSSSSASISSIQADISLVTNDGNIYNAYGSMNVNGTPGGFLFGSPAFEGSIFSVVVIQDNISAFSLPVGISASSGSVITSSGFLSLIPNFLFITAFHGTAASTSAEAKSASTAVANDLNTGSLSEIFSFNTSSNVSGLNYNNESITLYIFSSNPSFEQIANPFASNLLLNAKQNSAAAVFANSLKSGYLTPGVSSSSPSTSILVAGMINTDSLKNIFQSTVGQTVNVSIGSVAFSFGLSVWMNALHSSGTTHDITASQLFGYNNSLTEPSSSDISIIGIGYDNSSSSSFLLSSYNLTLITNNLTATGSAGFYFFSKIYSVSPSASINLDDYSIRFNATFTPDLTVGISSSRVSNNVYRLNVTLSNRDNEPVNNISINLIQFASYYNGSASFVGSDGKLRLASLNPDQTHTFFIDMKLMGVGTYRLPEIVANYTFLEKQFSTDYGYYEISVAPPSVAYAATSVVASSLSHFGMGFLGNYIGPLNILELIIILLIALTAITEYRKLRKRRTAVN
jgi:hypothetical protein